MTKIDTSAFTNWQDGNTVGATDYKRERDLISAAVNASDDQIKDRYTKAEVDSKDANLSSQILQVSLGNPPTPPNQIITLTLNDGLQIVNNTSRQSTLKNYNVKGRTLLNLLGTDGNCEDTSKWLSTNAIALDSANKVFGSNSIKATVANGSYNNVAKTITYSAAKNYLAVGYVKNGNLATGARLRFFEQASGIEVNSSVITDTTKFNFVFAKIPKNQYSGSNPVELGVVHVGANTQFGFMDGIAWYELSDSEYAALAGMTTAQLEAKYPYTEGIQGVSNPYVLKYGKNLLPPFSQWTRHANAVATKDYTLILTASGLNTSSVDIPIMPNTSYTLSFTQCVGTFKVESLDINGNSLATHREEAYTVAREFTTHANASKIRVTLYNTGASAGTFTFTNPMLNAGSIALPFEPQVNELLAIQDTFYANIDGTNQDELNEVGGKMIKTQNWQAMDLTGDLAWTFLDDQATYKRAQILSFTGASVGSSLVGAKYNGKPLKDNGDTTGADGIKFYNPGLVVSISDTDSGWGETYTPTAGEIQAYFYGWVMYDFSTGDVANKYNGSGTKGWAYRQANFNGAPSMENMTGGTTTLPTTLAPATGSFTPYKLLYRLATPVTYEVASEGSITLHEGNNQIETGVGMVVKERATPQVNGSFMVINHTAFPTSQLKNRANKILNVYKSSLKDETWAHFTGSEYGTDRVSTLIYDSTQPYTVTYSSLDLYKLSAPPTSVTAVYAPNDKTRLDDAVTKANQAEATVRALQNVKAERNQPQWVTPSLLNGWVAFDASPSSTNHVTAQYVKDSMGFVHLIGLIKSGTTTAGTALFILPVGYRPKYRQSFVTVSSNGTEIVSRISVYGDGVVSIQNGSNTFLSLSGITFLAEQ